jgi:Alpha-galactosidases/6-phospho-beta-glucosidases, family 4 of glycosyl hydrolases
MKITVIGGGSSYTPELVSGLLAKSSILPVTELWLMDIEAERLDIVGGFARRMVEARGSPFALKLGTDRREALEGASYVVSQIRVGKMAARREDEYLGFRHGLVGQETTGVGGFANALRTIPAVLDIAADVERYAPGALLLNFANPAGLVTEALSRYAPGAKAVGVCNVGITTKMMFIELFERLTREKIDPGRVELDTLGLNHLTWHRGLRVDGREEWGRVFPAYLEALEAAWAEGRAGDRGSSAAKAASVEAEWDLGTVRRLGMVPNGYLKYFYYTSRKLADQGKWPPSRAETVMEVEKELFARYANPDLVELPPELMKRGGAYYSELATRIMDDHWNDRGGVHVVNARNGDAVREWPRDWVLELPARVDRAGVHPLPAKALEGSPAGLVAEVKAYELQAVEAAVKGDRRAACDALLAHPLGPEADKVDPFLEDLLATNRAFLPRFFK